MRMQEAAYSSVAGRSEPRDSAVCDASPWCLGSTRCPIGISGAKRRIDKDTWESWHSCARAGTYKTSGARSREESVLTDVAHAALSLNDVESLHALSGGAHRLAVRRLRRVPLATARSRPLGRVELNILVGLCDPRAVPTVAQILLCEHE